MLRKFDATELARIGLEQMFADGSAHFASGEIKTRWYC
jgi:hypothetical protein